MTDEQAAALGRAIAENARRRGATVPEDVAMTAGDIASRAEEELGGGIPDKQDAATAASSAAKARAESWWEQNPPTVIRERRLDDRAVLSEFVLTNEIAQKIADGNDRTLAEVWEALEAGAPVVADGRAYQRPE